MSAQAEETGDAVASTRRAPGGAVLLDGKAVAAKVRTEVAGRAAAFAARSGAGAAAAISGAVIGVTAVRGRIHR